MAARNLWHVPVWAGLAFVAAPGTLATSAIGSENPEIRNETFSVSWDAQRGLSITAAGASRPFVTAGELRAAGPNASVSQIVDPRFGRVQVLRVSHAQAGDDEILLADGLPFVLIRPALRNSTGEVSTVRQVQACRMALDLGMATEAIRVLGTGGLASPADKPGSYMWMAAADPPSRRGVVAGWLTTDRGSGVVSAAVENGQLQLNAHLDYGRLRLAPGQTEPLETLAIGWFDDVRLGLEAWADAVAKVQQVHLPPQPAGYCTWYHSGASNEKELAATATLAAEKLAPFGFSVIQIDDGWQEGDPKGNGPRKNFTAYRAAGPYPGGMKAAADDVLARGLVPGIWFMPFAGTYNDPWFESHPDWFVKRADGTPYDTAWGGTCLDMTHPGMQEYLRGIVQRLTHEWGYRYLKMDGLYTGAGVPQIYVNDAYKEDGIGDAVFHDPDKTNIQAYRDGLKLVRETAGPEVFLLGCCANQNMRSYGGALGLVDAMRIGPDNGASWQGVLTGPTYGSRNYFLHGRVWYNDPDPVYVRSALTVEQARVSCSWAGITGQLTLGSDDFARLPPERLAILQRVLPAHGLQARPIDLFDEPLPRIWLVTDARREPRRDVLGLFNWSDQPQVFDGSLARIGLPAGGKYLVFDFWSGAMLPPLEDRLQLTVAPRSCAVLAVRAIAGHPQLLSTSRHVSQGMVDVLDERWDAGTRMLSGASRVVGGDDYELRIATYTPAGIWPVAAADVSAEDRQAGVALELREEAGFVRAIVCSPASREVRWQVTFQETPKPEPEPAAVSDLRAAATEPGGPVSLAWHGSGPFFEVRRDDAILSPAQGGTTLSDPTADPGKTYRFAVTSFGFDGRRSPAAQVSVQTPSIDPGPLPPLPDVSLTKLTPRSAAVGWGQVGVGRSAAGLPLTLGKEIYPDGIGLHAQAQVVYDCQPGWKRFVAVAGLDESRREDTRTSVVCEVAAEAGGHRTVLARSPVLKFGRVERWHFDVALPDGCQQVYVLVGDGDGSIASDHVDWVNAGFVTR